MSFDITIVNYVEQKNYNHVNDYMISYLKDYKPDPKWREQLVVILIMAGLLHHGYINS